MQEGEVPSRIVTSYGSICATKMTIWWTSHSTTALPCQSVHAWTLTGGFAVISYVSKMDKRYPGKQLTGLALDTFRRWWSYLLCSKQHHSPSKVTTDQSWQSVSLSLTSLGDHMGVKSRASAWLMILPHISSFQLSLKGSLGQLCPNIPWWHPGVFKNKEGHILHLRYVLDLQTPFSWQTCQETVWQATNATL